jgi:hypothetical protein
MMKPTFDVNENKPAAQALGQTLPDATPPVAKSTNSAKLL